MDLYSIFVYIVVALIPAGGCSCDAVGVRSYRLGPADVDLGHMEVFLSGADHVVVLKRPSGTQRIEVYVSKDGTAWQKAPNQERVALRHLVASSGLSPYKVLYRLSEDGAVLERSVNSGRSWIRAQLHFQGRDVEPIPDHKRMKVTIVGSNGLTVYARVGMREGASPQISPWRGVYVSQDGGDNWRLLANDLVVGTTVAERGHRVLAVSPSGLVESEDAGGTWSASSIAKQLPKTFRITGAEMVPPDRSERPLMVYQMEFPPKDPDSAFLVTNGGLFITHDRGRTWCVTTFNSDMFDMISSVALANDSGSLVFATTMDRDGPALWQSRNGGKSFERVSFAE